MSILHLALTLALVGLSASGASLAQAGSSTIPLGSAHNEKSGCSEVVLTRKPGWVLNGSFTPDGSRFLVVDSLYETILSYSRSGEFLGPIGKPVNSVLQSLLPVSGKLHGDKFILEAGDGFMILDKDLRPTSRKFLASNDQPKEGWSVGGVWQWQPVGKEDIVAFVDIVRNGSDKSDLDNWRTAFVRFPIENPGRVVVLKSFPLSGTPNKGYFRSGYEYIASIRETAYFLSMNEGITLFKSEKGKIPEDVSYLLPRSLRRPALPDWGTAKQYTAMMKQIEQATMPVGLHAEAGSLYLLYRSPATQGRSETRWELYTMDPSRKKPISQTELPIRANHVTVIPPAERQTLESGGQSWAFLEKGPVLGYGAQEISRVLLIPAGALRAPLRAPVCSVP